MTKNISINITLPCDPFHETELNLMLEHYIALINDWPVGANPQKLDQIKKDIANALLEALGIPTVIEGNLPQ